MDARLKKMKAAKGVVYWLFLATAALPLCGCVRRRMMVRTNPPGASIYVDKQLIGSSPAATSYTYYATREIEAVADGYRTEKVLRTLSPPWYQIPPLDFISETLWPWELRDERIVDITLVPAQTPSGEELLARADNLRLQASQGIATPITTPPPLVPPGAPIYPEPIVPPPAAAGPVWVPGQVLQNFFLPGGQPVQRIPETGILPGGGYRVPLPTDVP
jgi:hypothetical protein